jgi:dihydrofolate reductase / thymidylate synthase
MEVTIIVACDENNGIGKDNTIPWKSPRDMRFFKAITTGLINNIDDFLSSKSHKLRDDKQNAIIMGRNTANSFKSALSGRLNVVITSVENYREDEGFVSFQSLNAALNALKKRDDIHQVFVVGGVRLYDEAIQNNWCRRVLITSIAGNFDCDTALTNEFIETLKMFKGNHFYDFDEKTPGSIISMEEYYYINEGDRAYLDLGTKIIQKGHYRQNRNAKTYSLFGEKLEFELDENPDGSYTIPVLTTKQVFTRGINEELLFFMRGETDTSQLSEKQVRIWEGNTCREFLDAYGFGHLNEWEMGPMYGFIWRHFGAVYQGASHNYEGEGIDQIQDCVDKLVNDPNSRRILLTTYNPAQASQGVLYPCHGLMTQFYVEGDDRISLQTYQRSADYFLGLPFNITSYAVFLCLIVRLVNAKLEQNGEDKRYKPGRMITILGDVHIYSDLNEETGEDVDHVVSVQKQLERYYKTYRFPRIRIDKNIQTLSDLVDMESSDIKVMNYARHSSIRAKMVA